MVVDLKRPLSSEVWSLWSFKHVGTESAIQTFKSKTTIDSANKIEMAHREIHTQRTRQPSSAYQKAVAGRYAHMRFMRPPVLRMQALPGTCEHASGSAGASPQLAFQFG